MKEINFNTQGAIKSEAEQRLERGGRIVNFLDKINAYDYVNNIFDSEKEKPGFDEFKNFIIRINGIAREIPIKKRSFDGKEMTISGFLGTDALFPRFEDKEELLKYAYDSLMNSNRDDLAYSLPAIINGIHYFEDGNGRTSRTMHQLLECHTTEQEMLSSMKKALGEEGRFDTLDINPGLIIEEIQKIIFSRHGLQVADNGEPNFRETFRRVASVEFEKIEENHANIEYIKDFNSKLFVDGSYLKTVLCEVLGDDINKILTQKYGNNDISPLKMAEILSDTQWQEIFEKYYGLKKEYVKILIDVFAKPENYKSSEDSNVSVKNLFIQKINSIFEENKK
jgi:hypothetical protein